VIIKMFKPLAVLPILTFALINFNAAIPSCAFEKSIDSQFFKLWQVCMQNDQNSSLLKLLDVQPNSDLYVSLMTKTTDRWVNHAPDFDMTEYHGYAASISTRQMNLSSLQWITDRLQTQFDEYRELKLQKRLTIMEQYKLSNLRQSLVAQASEQVVDSLDIK
jgi:hypothetical protein